MFGIFRGGKQLRSMGSGAFLMLGSAVVVQSAMADMKARAHRGADGMHGLPEEEVGTLVSPWTKTPGGLGPKTV